MYRRAGDRRIDVYAQLLSRRRRFAILIVAIILIVEIAMAGDGVKTMFAPLVNPWTAAPTSLIELEPSLSVVGPSFTDRSRAIAFAAALQKSGVAAFVQRVQESQQFRVLLGPYVSSAETDTALQAVAVRGWEASRLFVDQTLTPEGNRAIEAARARQPRQPQVLAAAAPGMLSVVLEIPGRPRAFAAQRLAPTILDVEVQATGDVDNETWRAPDKVGFVKSIELRSASPSTLDRMRFRLTVQPEATSRIRMEGRRIYVDLAWADPPWPLPLVPGAA